MGRVESPDVGLSFLRRLHIFKSDGKAFAFDPESIRVEPLEESEYQLLKVISKEKKLSSFRDLPDWNGGRLSSIIAGIHSKKLGLPDPDDRADVQEFCKKVEFLVNASHVCNLSCAYCFVDSGRFSYLQKSRRKLPVQLAIKLIDALPKALPWAEEYSIHFYGGEPLLNLPAIKACIDASERLKDERFCYAITTNGTVLGNEVFSLLERGRFGVVLSLDGPAEIHDIVRRTNKGGKTHGRVLTFLQMLRERNGLSVRGSSVVRHGWSLKQASTYLKTLPVDLIKAQVVRVPPAHPLALTIQERADYIADIADLASDVVVSIRQNAFPKDDRFNHLVLQLLVRKKRMAFCGAGRWSFGMAADGTILPCALLAGREDLELGHIRNPSAEWARRGQEWADAHGPRVTCTNCWARPLCAGGCYAMVTQYGEEECDFMRATCEGALVIFAAFCKNNPQDLLLLAGLPAG